MVQSVVYLVSNHAQVNTDGYFRATSNPTNLSTVCYIPVYVENIAIKMTRELTVLPIPVFGVAAAIDYNVRRSVITLENIILADGNNGSTVAGSIHSAAGVSGVSTTAKGWIVDGVAFLAGDSSGVNSAYNSNASLDQKEVQRALFSRGVGLSWLEKTLVSPKINRIIWGEPALFSNYLVGGVSALTGMNQSVAENQGFDRIVWANVLITNATIKEVGGEPAKYECSLEANVIGFGGGANNPVVV